MTFSQMINDYLKYCEHDLAFKKRSLERYTYLIDQYKKYIINVCHQRDVEAHSATYLRGVNPADILRAMEDYAGTKSVKSEDTIRLYVSVVKEFFRYLHDNKIIECKYLLDSFGLGDNNKNSFAHLLKGSIKTLYERKILTMSSKAELMSYEVAKNVIACCDSNLSLSEINRLKDKEDAYNRYVKALIIKIILLTGAKVSPTIKNIQFDDVKVEEGYLQIKGYKIPLPTKLQIQLRDYLTIRLSGDAFFVFEKIEDYQPADVTSILERTLGIRSTTSLATYAILDMLDEGVDFIAIEEITGYGKNVLRPCVEMSNIDKNSTEQKISTLPLFSIL